jgi:hypothetical protein
MIMDKQLVLSDAQAVTASAASESVYDATGAPLNGVNIGIASTFGSDLGAGDGLRPKIAAYVNTTFATLTSLQVHFQGSTDGTTYTTYAETPAIVLANLTAGRQIAAFDWPLVPEQDTLPRYYRLYYTVAGSDATAGKIDAAIVLQQDQTRNSRGIAAAYTVAD